MRLGCIGIGSNAIRLLVAGWKNGQAYATARRERRGTRLFAGLVGGKLTEESMQSSVEAVGELAGCARADGAQKIFVFATSAVRDAANGRIFTERCEAICGTKVEIVSGEEEAVLSYIGASEGGACGMIDIGGGSTEFTLGEDERILGAVSLQMGAVRMNAQRPILKYEDYAATVEQCRRMIQRDAQGLLAFETKPEWVGVGGTMTTLGAMERAIPLFDAQTCEGMTLDLPTVAGWGRRLARMSMAERRQVPGLMAHRADIIPSGVAILEAAMREFGVNDTAAFGTWQHGRVFEEKISRKGIDRRSARLCIMILVVRTTALHIAGWSSLAARRAHNPKVVGSNPTPATIWRHSSAGQSIRFIPEVSCVRITLPLPEIPVKVLT